MSSEYIISLPAPGFSLSKDKFVVVDPSSPHGWRATGIRDFATRFLSMTEATLFAFNIDEEKQVLPVEGIKPKTTRKAKQCRQKQQTR